MAQMLAELPALVRAGLSSVRRQLQASVQPPTESIDRLRNWKSQDAVQGGAQKAR